MATAARSEMRRPTTSVAYRRGMTTTAAMTPATAVLSECGHGTGEDRPQDTYGEKNAFALEIHDCLLNCRDGDATQQFNLSINRP
jgi:hypothetical protein